MRHMKGDAMNTFLENLKLQAEANPLAALAVGVAVATTVTGLVNAGAGAMSRAAYARQIDAKLAQAIKPRM